MITIRNMDTAHSLSARASTADLVAGMLVVFVAAAASGDQPKVRKATNLEMADVTVLKGIVDYVDGDSQDVDFTFNTNTSALTAIAKLIPINAQVNVWFNKPIVAYHKSDLPVALDPATVREPAIVGFDAATNLPSLAAAAEITCGTIYRIDGPEVTFIFWGI